MLGIKATSEVGRKEDQHETRRQESTAEGSAHGLESPELVAGEDWTVWWPEERDVAAEGQAKSTAEGSALGLESPELDAEEEYITLSTYSAGDEGNRDESATTSHPEGGTGTNVCPICKAWVTKINRHVQTKHMPWFFVPELACWTCRLPVKTMNDLLFHERLCPRTTWAEEDWIGAMVTVLHRTADALRTSVEGLRGLAVGINERLSPVREQLLIEVERAQGRKVDSISLEPLSCPSAVLAVPIFTTLLCQMSEAQVRDIQDIELDDCQVYQPTPAEVVDGHVHLRQCDQKASLWRTVGWERVPEVKKIRAVINNQVFPGDWATPHQPEAFGVHHTFGVHPRIAAKGFDPEEFERRAWARKFVALGETGLDETAPNLEEQELALFHHARLAKRMRKPLVLHVRSVEERSDELYGRTMLVLKKADLHRKQKVYLHSFTGSYATFMEWRKTFPNLLLGISWLSATSRYFEDVAQIAPAECLAVESDGPHLSPVQAVNRPQYVVFQAKELAKIRHLPLNLMLKVCARNTASFYDFKL